MVWVIIGYSLVTASILLNFGRLGDIFGRVKLYTLGFTIFTFGSGLCSVSQSGEQLVVFRIIQAIGAAFIFSNSIAILTDSFPSNERGKALGINQIAIVLGSVLGLGTWWFFNFLPWLEIYLLDKYSDRNNWSILVIYISKRTRFNTKRENRLAWKYNICRRIISCISRNNIMVIWYNI